MPKILIPSKNINPENRGKAYKISATFFSKFIFPAHDAKVENKANMRLVAFLYQRLKGTSETLAPAGDLAVNAEKATGFLHSREIPVLWAITKGSFINKLIIVPIALLLNVYFPIAIVVILVLGGVYLAYEGAEKIVEFLFHRKKKGHEVIEEIKEDPELEKAKIKSAITTDFILSVEIVIIALGSVLDKSLTLQILTVSVVALLATVGVYGIVAIIVRMDDAGLSLIKRDPNKGIRFKLGTLLVALLPIIIKFLAFVGTIALLMVSGGIFVHSIEFLHHLLPGIPVIIKEFVIGLLVGVVVVGLVMGIKRIFGKK